MILREFEITNQLLTSFALFSAMNEWRRVLFLKRELTLSLPRGSPVTSKTIKLKVCERVMSWRAKSFNFFWFLSVAQDCRLLKFSTLYLPYEGNSIDCNMIWFRREDHIYNHQAHVRGTRISGLQTGKRLVLFKTIMFLLVAFQITTTTATRTSQICVFRDETNSDFLQPLHECTYPSRSRLVNGMKRPALQLCRPLEHLTTIFKYIILIIKAHSNIEFQDSQHTPEMVAKAQSYIFSWTPRCSRRRPW